MHLIKGRRVYLPLVLLFWLLGSVGSFALGKELHYMPQALSGFTSVISQDLGSLVAAMGAEARAVQPEKGPATLTAQSNPPQVATTSAPHTAAPAASHTPATSTNAHHGDHEASNHGHDGDGSHKSKHGGGHGHDSGGSDD